MDADGEAAFEAVAATAVMLPLLPCGDIDAMAEFWTGLGLELTYRQLRPNPMVAVGRGGIQLQYYGLPDWDPAASHSTCVVGVADTGPVHAAFAEALRRTHGRLPTAGVPRMTRPRPRANNEGLAGFSVVDPAGNWVRFSRLASSTPVPDGDTAPWRSGATGPLGRALENAVVLADSKGDEAQALRILRGALRREPDGGPVERAQALAFVVDLSVRVGDREGAETAARELEALDVGPDDATARAAVDDARREAAEILGGPDSGS